MRRPRTKLSSYGFPSVRQRNDVLNTHTVEEAKEEEERERESPVESFDKGNMKRDECSGNKHDRRNGESIWPQVHAQRCYVKVRCPICAYP